MGVCRARRESGSFSLSLQVSSEILHGSEDNGGITTRFCSSIKRFYIVVIQLLQEGYELHNENKVLYTDCSFPGRPDPTIIQKLH